MSDMKFEIMQIPGSINFDYEFARNQILAKMDEYRGLVFTEETKKDGKKDLAAIRKYRKNITDEMVKAKKIYMKPFDEVNSKVKELLSVVDESISFIDSQLKELEEKRAQEKRAEIELIYNELVPEELQDYLPLDDIYGPKWNNATISFKSIKQEIVDLVNKTNGDISVISAMGSDKVQDALNIYMTNRNLADAVKYINQYEARKREILAQREKQEEERAERLRQEEVEKIRREERERIAEEERIRNEAKKEVVEEIKTVNETAAAPLVGKQSKKVVYTIVATDEEIHEIEMAFDSLGIYFERKDV